VVALIIVLGILQIREKGERRKILSQICARDSVEEVRLKPIQFLKTYVAKY
jgi:hypothetical protein